MSETSYGETYGSEQTEWYEQEFPPDVEFFVPVRVAASRAPQLVARVNRSNWTDYVILAPAGEEIRRVFSFSCREDNAISWRSGAHGLAGIVTYDKFEPVPPGLKVKEAGAMRWMLVCDWIWSLQETRWKKRTSNWVAYTFGDPLPTSKQVLPSQVSFRWM